MREDDVPDLLVIQARLAAFATVVDENVNGVRVVKSFAQEQAELANAGRPAKEGRVAPTSRRRHPRPVHALGPELSLQVGTLLVLGIGGCSSSTVRFDTADSRLQLSNFGMHQARFMMLASWS